MRVTVVQRYLPAYRLPFFDRATSALARLGITMEVLYSVPLGGVGVAALPAHYHRLDTLLAQPMHVAGVGDRLIVQRGLMSHLHRSCPALVICEDLGALPSAVTVALYARRTGTPYLIWGLGYILGKPRSVLRRLFGPLIGWLYRGAAGFIAYSDFAAGYYRQTTGKPTWPIYNSALPRAAISDHDFLALRTRLAAPGPARLIYVGQLTAQKRASLLIDSVALLGDRNWRLDIVGDGPERGALEARAAAAGIADRVQFHGAIYDDAAKADLFAAAHLCVMPGLGGLVIQEAYCHGVPVVAGPSDGTELDLVRDVLPDLYLPYPSAETLGAAIGRFLDLPAVDRANASALVLNAVRDRYNLDCMADLFVDALSQALASRT